MRKKTLTEMVKTAKNAKFFLPYNIKSRKELLSNGTWCHVFRHDELGELGRILIIPCGAKSQICCEVAGDPNDPMTAKRREIFEPIGKEISKIMSLSCGESEDVPEPYISPREEQVVKSMVYPCQSCNGITAMLIFADDAETTSRLEDCARKMYSKIQELNVPTWIVGRESENIVNGKDLRKSLVLKVHPNREDAKIMTPDDLMDIIDRLMDKHCTNDGKEIEECIGVSSNEQVQRYEYIRETLDRIRITFMMSLSQEAVMRSASRLEISQGDSTLLLNTEHEMNFFCEYCVFHYRMNGVNLIEAAYNKSHREYEGEALEIFKRAKAVSFRFLKLIDPIKEKEVLAYDELKQENYKIVDKKLHKSFSKNQQTGNRYYLLSYMAEFKGFIITTGASVIVNIDTGAGRLVYERFEQHLRLASQGKPEDIAETRQYITDMHKIALHEGIVGEVPSNTLPFGRKGLEAKVMKNRTVH